MTAAPGPNTVKSLQSRLSATRSLRKCAELSVDRSLGSMNDWYCFTGQHIGTELDRMIGPFGNASLGELNRMESATDTRTDTQFLHCQP